MREGLKEPGRHVVLVEARASFGGGPTEGAASYAGEIHYNVPQISPPWGQGAPKGSGTVPVVRPMGGAFASSPKPSLGGVRAWLLGPLTRAKGGVTHAVRGTGIGRTQAELVVFFFSAPRFQLPSSVR